MSRKTALILTTALTVFVLIVAGALAMRLGASNADPTPAGVVGPTTATVAATIEAVLKRESQYQQRLQEANAQLLQAYEQIRQLQAQLQQLQVQNATLLEREQIYQRRLQEANRLLQQSAAMASSWPSGPANQLQAGRAEHWGEWEYEGHQREWGEWDDD